MKTKFLAVFSLFLAFFSLSSCSSNSIYGRYSLQMGKTGGTHFIIAANLGQETSPFDSSKKAFYFDYQNVYVPSSSSVPTSSSTSSSSDSSTSSSSSDDQGLISDLFPIQGAWALGADQATIEMDIWFADEEVIDSSYSSAMSSLPASSSSVPVSSSTSSSSEEPTGPFSIPYSFNQYFLKIKLNGKNNLVITLPVSIGDAITAIEAYLDGKSPEEVKINVVEIELSKE